MASERRTALMARASACIVSLTLAACGTDGDGRVVAPGNPSLAKGAGGGGGGGGGGGVVAVSAATPASAPQDTTIDVTLSGSGFTKGARATWVLAGDTSVVHVLSTTYVNSTTLIARVNVPGSAPTTRYDVEVALVDGKKGVGAELFEVLSGDPKATFYFPMSSATLGLRGDGRQPSADGQYSTYANGVCGISAKIFATEQLSNSGDATMQTNNPRFKSKSCTLRTVTIDYGDGSAPETTGTFINVRGIANTTFQIPIGSTVRRALLLDAPRCSGLRWRPVLSDGTSTGADEVEVTRVAPDTWRVRSQPYPNDKAYCVATGRLYNVSVDFTIQSSYPLP